MEISEFGINYIIFSEITKHIRYLKIVLRKYKIEVIVY